MSRWNASLVALIFAAGCLGSTYEIPRDELLRLAEARPEDRGGPVRVVQQYGTADEPPSAPPVYIHTPVLFVYSGPRHYRDSRRTSVGAVAGGSGSVSGGGSGGGNDGGADASIDSAVVVVVLAAAAGVGLAFTEGLRYDGWASLHPMHPVHLELTDGTRAWVPLAQLDPALVAETEEAVVRVEEGPWELVGRAPLDRVGFTYGVELGGAGLATTTGGTPTGFLSRVQLGGFPIQQLGFLATLGLGWGDTDANDTLFNARYALELHAYPAPPLWRLHFGFYGQAGYAYVKEDVGALGTTYRDYHPFWGGGGLFQLDLTTRLALTGRIGFGVYEDGDAPIAHEWSLGLAIY